MTRALIIGRSRRAIFVDRGLFVKQNSRHATRVYAVPPISTHTFPAILTPAAEENRYVAVMFIEHDFSGFAGIRRELDCFNEPERVSRTDEFAVRQRYGRVTENENLICRSIPSVAFCVAICPRDVNS